MDSREVNDGNFLRICMATADPKYLSGPRGCCFWPGSHMGRFRVPAGTRFSCGSSFGPGAFRWRVWSPVHSPSPGGAGPLEKFSAGLYRRYSVKNDSILSKGMRSVRSYRSTWLAPGMIRSSLLSPARSLNASSPK